MRAQEREFAAQIREHARLEADAIQREKLADEEVRRPEHAPHAQRCWQEHQDQLRHQLDDMQRRAAATIGTAHQLAQEFERVVPDPVASAVAASARGNAALRSLRALRDAKGEAARRAGEARARSHQAERERAAQVELCVCPLTAGGPSWFPAQGGGAAVNGRHPRPQRCPPLCNDTFPSNGGIYFD